MLTVGTLIQVKTRTKDNVFGEVVYEILETGLPTKDGVNDGIKTKMLGGNGPSARSGLVIFDTDRMIKHNIKEGITKVIAPERKASIVSYYASTKK